jgi:polyisoprenyl-phosphate glycosyltransferase
MVDRHPQLSDFISIVIPLHKEGDIVEKTVHAILKVVEPLNWTYELVLIDDGSPDNTWSTIERLADDFAAIRGIRFSRNFGKEAAICAGLEMAKGNAVIVMDGDLQHPPSLIPEMVRLWRECGADVIEGVKEDRGKETFWSRLSSKFFNFIFHKLTGYDLRGASDYKLLDRQVVEAFLQMKERNIFFRGMSAWVGFKRLKLPFSVADRVGGKSNWSGRRLLGLALTAVTSFSPAPLHLITLMGVCFAVFAFVLGVQAAYMTLTGAGLGGFPTVIITLLIIGCAIMFALGIIGEYVARIYEEVKGRPRYVVVKKIGGGSSSGATGERKCS